MIQGLIKMMATNDRNTEIRSFELSRNFFNMTNYVDGDGSGVDKLLQGLINQPAQVSSFHESTEHD